MVLVDFSLSICVRVMDFSKFLDSTTVRCCHRGSLGGRCAFWSRRLWSFLQLGGMDHRPLDEMVGSIKRCVPGRNLERLDIRPLGYSGALDDLERVHRYHHGVEPGHHHKLRW